MSTSPAWRSHGLTHQQVSTSPCRAPDVRSVPSRRSCAEANRLTPQGGIALIHLPDWPEKGEPYPNPEEVKKVRKVALKTAETKRYLSKMKVERPEKYRELMRGRERRAAAAKSKRRQESVIRKEYERRYRKEHAGRRSEIRRERYAAEPQFRIAQLLRSRLRRALIGKKKTGSAVELLGCSIDDAVTHIERQFHKGMTWANRGTKWHLDHIRPLAGFDLTDPDQLSQACHFTNLMPLPASENISKKDQMVYLL